MTRSKIKRHLESVRKRIAELKKQEKELEEQKRIADEAANLHLIQLHNIDPEQLRRMILTSRNQNEEILRNAAEEEERQILVDAREGEERRPLEKNGNEEMRKDAPPIPE